jgi:RNA polymerase sigma factor (sigma-70 family)
LHHVLTPLIARERARGLADAAKRAAPARATGSLEIAELVRSAQRGDQHAWKLLVIEFTPALRRVIRRCGLHEHDVDDVMQVTWIHACTGLRHVREPAAIAGWLGTTARCNALRLRRRTLRGLPADTWLADEPQAGPSVEDEVIDAERAAALRSAVGRLPSHQRAVVEALLDERAGGYRAISAEVGIPIGSIGPTRARALVRLFHDGALARAIVA